VFRRRTPTEPPSPDDTAVPPSQDPATAAGRKGRPTPSRREAEQQRRERLTPPRDRRSAAKQARQRSKAERDKARRALVSGDERALPPRDAGPVRKFARDYVDARRCAAEFFLPGALVVLVLSLMPILVLRVVSQYLWLVMVLLIVLDSTIVSRGLTREARRRFPDENRKGLVLYALMRSMQIRRLRLPPPRVKPGHTV
jgi:Protein of unknown function (DUF3043)